MRTDLGGLTAFVTGGANGIGRAIARILSDNGAGITIADIDAAGAERVAGTLPRAIGVAMDVRDLTAVQRAVDATLDKFGRLDILVNNAGVNSF